MFSVSTGDRQKEVEEKNLTYSRFGDVLSVSSLHDCADQGFDASHLADHHLVPLVVAGEVGENARSTSDHVDVIAGQQLDQHVKEAVQLILLKVVFTQLNNVLLQFQIQSVS